MRADRQDASQGLAAGIAVRLRPRLAWEPKVLLSYLPLAAVIAITVLAPWVSPHDPLQLKAGPTFDGPSSAHPFGTDQLGRDVLSRVMNGYRYSLSVAVIVLIVVVPLGMTLGLAAGYLGPKVDNLVMRVTDIFMAFPPIILALAIAAALGPGLKNTTIAIMVTWWPWYVRLMRGQVLATKELPYVEAARVLGASPLRIMFVHLLRNSWAPILVVATVDFGIVILTTSGLSFVGLGASPPIPDLGVMIAEGRRFMQDSWWIATFPGLAIALAAVAAQMASDALRDQLDPAMRRRT